MASGIAEAQWHKAAWVAIRLALPAWILPFMFVYNNSLLGMGSPWAVIFSFGPAILGMYLLAAGAIGYLARKARTWERLVLVLAGLLLIIPQLTTDLIGLAVGLAMWLYQRGGLGRRPAAAKVETGLGD